MTLIKAENRELTHSRYQSTKGIPTTSPKTRGTGLLLGTDFRHAVEFSRSGRAETRPFRASQLAGCPTLRRFPETPHPGGLVRRPIRAARRKENVTPSSEPLAEGVPRP